MRSGMSKELLEKIEAQVAKYKQTQKLGKAAIDATIEKTRDEFQNYWQHKFLNQPITFQTEDGKEQHHFQIGHLQLEPNTGNYSYNLRHEKSPMGLIESDLPIELHSVWIHPVREKNYSLTCSEANHYFKQKNIKPTPESKKLLDLISNYKSIL